MKILPNVCCFSNCSAALNISSPAKGLLIFRPDPARRAAPWGDRNPDRWPQGLWVRYARYYPGNAYVGGNPGNRLRLT